MANMFLLHPRRHTAVLCTASTGHQIWHRGAGSFGLPAQCRAPDGNAAGRQLSLQELGSLDEAKDHLNPNTPESPFSSDFDPECRILRFTCSVGPLVEADCLESPKFCDACASGAGPHKLPAQPRQTLQPLCLHRGSDIDPT